jgi:putative SOS response-associated peptidase YedK
MCGRFKLTTPLEELEALFGIQAATNLQPRYNIAPTQDACVIGLTQDGQRELRSFRWGLVPSWATDTKMAASMINARAETIQEKPAFRQAFAKRRCLVPVDGFYEWAPPAGAAGTGKRKQPVLLTLPGNQCFAFAGLWEGWRGPDGMVLRSFTIVTTEAVPSLQQLHHRMPVILPRDSYATWLARETSLAEAQNLLRPYIQDPIAQTPVGEAVSNVRIDDSRCIAPPAQPLL